MYSLYQSCDCSVCTDSRRVKSGDMFFALKGENFNGNDYALSALEKGAAAAVVDDPALAGHSGVVLVEDSFAALQSLAVYHRTHVADGQLKVIGLTGTNGKTTTKNLISLVLSKKYRVVATEGNLNNDIGVPLSLLKVRPDTQIAVIEMGANHPDDITRLVQVCTPDYGLITNIGVAHIQGFGSFEGVVKAKNELYRYLGSKPGSLIFVNEDDELLRSLSSKQSCHCFGYGLKYQDQGAEILKGDAQNPNLRLKLKGRVISTQLFGEYNAANVLAALCVGEYFGVDFEAACEAVEEFCPNNKRSQMLRTERNTLIVDAYNANPSSMAAALQSFSNMSPQASAGESAEENAGNGAGAGERKLALLGQMRELGACSLEEHERVLCTLRSLGIDAWLVGEEFRNALAALESGGMASGDKDVTFRCFDSSADLASYLHSNPLVGYTILIKGSRSVEMEKVLGEL